ncbi:MAG: pirin family protein [Litorivicinaceae bacterium]
MTQQSIQAHIIPRTSDIGQLEVKRALPSAGRRAVGPFVFWDQMGPGELLQGRGVDVRPHPHIGLATLTYLFAGQIEHRDSLGVRQLITPGAINLMTAGSGIVHSERSDAVSRAGVSPLFGVQSWLALPKAQEGCDPDFLHIPATELPEFDGQGVRGRVVLGAFEGVRAPTPFPMDALYLDLTLDAGAVIEIPAQWEERALYPVTGALEIDGHPYPTETLLVLHPQRVVRLKALHTPVHVLLFGGEPLDGPRYLWWNFVASDRERLESAKAEWREGRFPQVPGETEWIPLPEA